MTDALRATDCVNRQISVYENQVQYRPTADGITRWLWLVCRYVQSPHHTYTKHNLIQYVLWTDPSLPTHRKKSVNVCIFTPPRQGSSVLRSVSVCVCLSVCLSASIFLEPLERSSRNFCADPRGRFLKGWVSLSPNFRQKGRRPPNTVGVKN